MPEVFDGMMEAFVFETSQNLKQLELTVLSAEERGSFSEGDINEIFRIMHTIKGSSAMMEYGEISSLAHTLEDLFFFLRENKPKYNCSETCDLIFSVIDFFSGELEMIRAGMHTSPLPDQLVDKITRLLDALKEQGAKAPEKAAKAPGKKKASLSPRGKRSVAENIAILPYFILKTDVGWKAPGLLNC